MKRFLFVLFLLLPIVAVGEIETDGMAFYVLYKTSDATAQNFDIKAHAQNSSDKPARRWAAVALVDTAYVTMKKDGVAYDTMVIAPGTSVSSDQIGNPQVDFVRLRRVSTSGYVAFIAFYDR
jgi:hypothetical protein